MNDHHVHSPGPPAAPCPEHRHVAAVVATLWALVGGLLVIYGLLFALTAAGRILHPVEEFAYGESWLLDGARRVARGEGLYAAADHVPLMHIAYTPLYYAVVGSLQRLLGDYGYSLGRIVSLVATLGGAAALVWSIKHLTHRWSAGLLGAALFLTQNMTALLWAPLHRVDPLALGLSLGGLALATAGRVSLSAFMFLLAILTKQTYVIAPLAVAVALWPCRHSLLRFAAVLVCGAVAALVVGQWLTGGWFLWHTLTANSNEPDLMTFSALMGSFLQFNGLPVLAALTSCVLPAAGPPERMWRLYLIGCLITLFSVSKLGASSNYWLELSAASAAVLALTAHRLTTGMPSGRLVAPVVLAGSLLIAVPAYQAVAVQSASAIAEQVRPPAPRFLSLVGDGDGTPAMRVESSFIDQIAAEPGALLTDNPGLAVAAGKPIQFEFQIFQLLQAEGHWSERPILDAVAARRFSLVALMHPLDGPVDGTRWTPALREAIRAAYLPAGAVAAYLPAGQVAGFWLYRPRP